MKLSSTLTPNSVGALCTVKPPKTTEVELSYNYMRLKIKIIHTKKAVLIVNTAMARQLGDCKQ